MKKSVYCLGGILFLFGLTARSQELNLDDILSKYYQAAGIEKMKDFQTIYYDGKSNTMGMEYPFKIYKKRPGKSRIEVEIQGSKMIQVYDGQKGWSVIPWSGSTEPQDMTVDEAKNLKDQSEFEGSLYNWKEKGYKVDLVDKEDLEGSSVYKIKLTKPDGDTETYFIDADNFIILKVSSMVKIQGNESEGEVDYSDYKPVEGVLMPFTFQNKFKGQAGEMVSQIIFDTIVINKEINDSLFLKPVKK